MPDEFRLVFTTDDLKAIEPLMTLASSLKGSLGCNISAKLLRPGQRMTEPRLATSNMARIAYKAVLNISALQELAEGTVQGAIYRHLIDKGQQTVPQIRQAGLADTDKAVQSAVHKLFHMGLLEKINIKEA